MSRLDKNSNNATRCNKSMSQHHASTQASLNLNSFGMLCLEPIRGGCRFWAGQAGDGGEE